MTLLFEIPFFPIIASIAFKIRESGSSSLKFCKLYEDVLKKLINLCAVQFKIIFHEIYHPLFMQ
jgi:hypothetical protein